MGPLAQFIFLLAASPVSTAPSTSAPPKVILPVEVVGSDGTTGSVNVFVPAGSQDRIRSLWMQIHGLEFDGMVSVQVNESPWMELTNASVAVAEPGRSYGGIGGGFSTLKLTLPLPVGTVLDGGNTIRFRFNRTDGVVSGFRLLKFNFADADGHMILPSELFAEDDPNAWTSPLEGPENVAWGKALWHEAPLKANGLRDARPIRAHCADCHSRDGRDLKYFNFSNASIVARSRFHGLTEVEGRLIASYIRTLPGILNPGRPWNPPYQPGPGLDAQPVSNWAAGAGLQSVLENDADTLNSLFPGNHRSGSLVVTANVFRPDANLNVRTIPIALQLPDWNHWLPRVHPLDAASGQFEGSEFSRLYQNPEATALFFDKWIKARTKFLTPRLAPGSKRWTRDLGEAFYAAELWQLVKTWEIVQELNLEAGPRTWPSTIPIAAAPASANIPDGPNGMGGSALSNEYFNNAWYELQLLVNSGNHRHHDRTPIDWVYFVERILALDSETGRPEPGRLLVAILKAIESSDPKAGPDNFAEGWRPERNVDPRILTSPRWAQEFSALPPATRLAMTEAFLTAWLDKNEQYSQVSYFERGRKADSYQYSAESLDITGGNVFEAVAGFQALGVRRPLVERLERWGQARILMAERFQY